MLNLKKTAVAVLAFSSSAVFAGTMGPVCTPGNVTVPCERSAWDFGVQALYLEPSFTGANYVGAVQTASNSQEYQSANRWGWGFKLEGSYHFNTGNDVNLNWYHLNRSNTIYPVAGFTDFTADTFASGLSITRKPQWNAVNLEFGQHIDFSQNSNVRVHAGVGYANLQTTGSKSTTGAAGTGSSALATSASSSMKYNGFGPRMGADLGYTWGNGLSVYGNSAAALFVGSSKFNSTVTYATNTAFSGYQSGSATTIVPELEAKLGAMYTYALAQGDLSLDVGWMWINYFNANQMGTFGNPTVQTDVALQGPYIGLKWIGNVA